MDESNVSISCLNISPQPLEVRVMFGAFRPSLFLQAGRPVGCFTLWYWYYLENINWYKHLPLHTWWFSLTMVWKPPLFYSYRDLTTSKLVLDSLRCLPPHKKTSNNASYMQHSMSRQQLELKIMTSEKRILYTNFDKMFRTPSLLLD